MQRAVLVIAFCVSLALASTLPFIPRVAMEEGRETIAVIMLHSLFEPPI
jgi:hypothetical protein